MPLSKNRPSAIADRPPNFKEEAEQNYIELVTTIRHTQGMFALLPVKSNYSVAKRDALLRRLANDLGEISLRLVRLTHESWDVGLLIAGAAAELSGPGAIVLVGLEETPGIVPAAGEENRRPPALAILNHAREAIRSHCPYPLVLWCDPLTYRALRERAPDFFDYFMGLFSFEETKAAEAESGRTRRPSASSDIKVSDEVTSSLVRGSPVALGFYEEQVAKNPEPTLDRARALLGLAETLWAHQDLDLRTRLIRAEQTAIEAAGILSKQNSPADWARGQLILGRIYSSKACIEDRTDFARAMTHYEAALQVYGESSFPFEWAQTQNSLGIAYAKLPGGGPAENLRRGITCFEAASRVYTETEFPQDWAMIQNNLGSAYQRLATGNQVENFHRALACYSAALRVYTHDRFPWDWAMTQSNLGLAYQDSPTGDPGENLRRAIACYEAALRVFTKAEGPHDWAATQDNLAHAYLNLPAGDRAEHLRQAIAGFEAALRVFTEREFPQNHFFTQSNLRAARQELAQLQSAPA